MEIVKRRATIVEVAERANVAFSTVSRVLNGGYASQQVRERVEQAAKDLGYTPSSIARNLKMGRQGCIGVVVESSQGSWFTQVLGGIEEALEEKTISALLGSLELRGRYDQSAVQRWITERRVDGLIFARCTPMEETLVERAKKARIPMVFVAPDEHFGAGPVFSARNRDAAHEIADHLMDLGHRRIGFVGGPGSSHDTIERLKGLREGLATRGLEINPAHLAFAEKYAHEGGIAFAEKWLSLPRTEAPTAVIGGNDAIAIGFLRTVLQHGVRVPDEVSVVGFDGIREGALYWPGLTTAQQPSHVMGTAACKALLRAIDNRGTDEPSRVDLPTTLVVRESTGPAPGTQK
jgi:DNA-binding LacI/PurR family transcriptional regulator